MTVEPCDALVLGADEHTGLATARNLHREGVRVGPHGGSDNFQLRDPMPVIMGFFLGLPIIAKRFVRAVHRGRLRAAAGAIVLAPYLATLADALPEALG
jgi:hypothetical protein